MLSAPQIEASRAALYGADPDMRQMPVSPLSIAERAVSLLLAVNPDLQLMVLGGDHSVAWPVLSALARVQREPWAIVHIDAHTDLLPERLGVKYCFATWAYHANQLLGGGGRLIQIGIRASGKTREHWEQTLGVRQIWAGEALARGADAVVAEVVAHLRAIGARRVYFSNDIDGTDAALAPSTGAPASGGLSVEMVRALINGVGQVFPFVGADLVEVAPPIGSAEDARRTTAVGACYILDTIGAMLGATGEKWRKTAAAMATTVTAATTARP
jgi:agmatinase